MKLTSIFPDTTQLLLRIQANGGRLLDRLPHRLQKRLTQPFSTTRSFDQLHPMLKCILAVQRIQGHDHVVSEHYQEDRVYFRTQMRALVKQATPIQQVKDITLDLPSGTIRARCYHPHPRQKLPTIVFYHGGGFVIGDLETHDEACRVLAHTTQAQVISVDYPLAPEYGPKHITQICVEAFTYLANHAATLGIMANRLAVAGDSAGGNLATVVSQTLVNQTYCPNAQLLIYPVVDFANRHLSYYRYQNGLILTEEDARWVKEFYLNRYQIDSQDPLVSPTYGRLQRTAPAFIVTAEHDILRDEGQIYAFKLKAAQVPVQHQHLSDMMHGFIQFTPIIQDTKDYWIRIGQDFRRFWDMQK